MPASDLVTLTPRSGSHGVASMTTPNRLDWTTHQVEADLADLRRQGPAVKAFYAQLSPDQRRAFDRLTAPKGGPEES